MSQALIERIDEALRSIGRSERAALLAAGASPDLIRDIRRKRGSPTIDTVAKLAQALDVSPAWLAFGAAHHEEGDAPRLVPILGRVAAGAWQQTDDGVDEPRANRKLAADPRYPVEAQFGVTATGDSMNRLFSDQDDLLCLDFLRLARGPRPADGSIVIVEQLRDGGALRELSAKQLRFSEAGPILAACSDHPKWRDFTLTPSPDADNDNAAVRITAIVLRSERQWWAA